MPQKKRSDVATRTRRNGKRNGSRKMSGANGQKEQERGKGRGTQTRNGGKRKKKEQRGRRGDGSESRVIVLSTIFQDAYAVVTASVQR